MMTRGLLSIALLSIVPAVVPYSASAQVKIDHIQWRVDLISRRSRTADVPGTAQIFVRNTSKKTVSLKSITVNGRTVESLKEGNEVTWWRLLPSELKPGDYGSIMVRMRATPKSAAPVVVGFSDGSSASGTIDPQKQNAGFRIESIGFAPGGRRVIAYFRQYDSSSGWAVRSVSASTPGWGELNASWISQRFVLGLAAVELTHKRPLPAGEFLYLKAVSENGRTTCYLIRISDGYVPLGTYDWPNGIEADRLAIAGMTNVTMHHAFEPEILDDLHTLGMRGSGYTHYNEPSPLYSTHPAMGTCLVTDEPDCQDYFFFNKKPDAPPGNKRVGYHARKVVEGAELIHKANKRLQAGLVLDLTYTPEAYCEYGETVDVIYSDNYALTHGAKPDVIWRDQRNAMAGAAPNPVVHIFDDCWQEREGRGINRPKTASEQRRIMLYAFGAGAKGLVGWWNVRTSDPNGTSYHPAEDHPDQWAAIADVFQSLGPLSALISISQPIDAVKCANPKVWTSALMAGREALMITVVNDDFEYSHERYVQSPAEDVVVRVSALPWLKPAAAYRMKPGAVEKLPMDVGTDGSAVVKLGRVWAGDVVLVTSDPGDAGELLAEYQERQDKFAAALLATQRKQVDKDSLSSGVQRDLALNRAKNMVQGSPVGPEARTARDEAMNNPTGEADNAVLWELKDGMADRPVARWPLDVETIGPAVFVVQASVSMNELEYVLTDSTGAPVSSKGNAVRSQALDPQWTMLSIDIPASGKYELRAIHSGHRGRGGRLARWAYFIPGATPDDIVNNRRAD